MIDLHDECRLLSNAIGKISLTRGTNVQIDIQEERGRSVGWGDGKPHVQHVSSTKGYCVRVLRDGGEGVLSSRHLTGNRLVDLVSRAAEIARLTLRDPHRKIIRPLARYPDAIPADKTLFSTPAPDITDRLRRLERQLLRQDKRIKKVVKMRYEEARSRHGLVNSYGLSLSKEFSSAAFSIELLAGEDHTAEAAWDMSECRFARDLSLEETAVEVAAFGASSVGGRSLPSGKMTVLLHPRVGAMFLHLWGTALSAEAVQYNRSFLRDRLGEKVCSERITMIDDPLQPRGVASAPFDDEGVPHRKLPVIDRGVLKNFFYDLRSAHRAGVESNGHGLKAALSSHPAPEPTNFFIMPGNAAREDLLCSYEKVFLVRDVMGLHMANPITGDFSLGAAGFLYRRGRLVRPVRGVTLSGRLLDVFEKSEGVGRDLTWVGPFGAPSLLISEMTVAGS
ncbi:MAG: TldD/PmbA family protein [Elusimicrobia bacterium]|nr:TldD/PmbA family protein [Candidatus Obscuribacterium magneticum]